MKTDIYPAQLYEKKFLFNIMVIQLPNQKLAKQMPIFDHNNLVHSDIKTWTKWWNIYIFLFQNRTLNKEVQLILVE